MGKENITFTNKKILMQRVIRLKLDDDLYINALVVLGDMHI